MQKIYRYLGVTVPLIIGGLYLVSCSAEDNPFTAEPGSTEYTVTVLVEPPAPLRTPETKDWWTEPVQVNYSIDGSASATKPFHSDSLDNQWYIGSQHADSMEIILRYGSGRDLYEMHGPGMMSAMHPGQDAHHYMVELYSSDSLWNGFHGQPMTGGDVTLIATSESDTLEYPLDIVMGKHGYAYETNAELPGGTYDLQLQVNPPEFYRTNETQNFWTDGIILDFQSFTFDTSEIPGTIGNQTVVSNNGDTLEFFLSGEEPRLYGTLGMQWEPLTGEETIRFSLEIENSSIDYDRMPIYGSQVQISIRHEASGDTETTTLKPIYGHHGFYFGENMNLEMMDDAMHNDDGSHGNPGDHMGDDNHGGGGGMGMGGM